MIAAWFCIKIRKAAVNFINDNVFTTVHTKLNLAITSVVNGKYETYICQGLMEEFADQNPDSFKFER